MSVLPSPLVSAAWLQAHMDDVRILDVRSMEDYQRTHIHGARWVSFDQLGTPSPHSGARRPLPAPVDFAALMNDVGVHDQSLVVVYDDERGSHAARLWWMLDSLGVSCGVLDGGIALWDGERESGLSRRCEPSPAFTPRPWPRTHFIEADEVADDSQSALILDARSAARFGGQESPLDPQPGHIPNAQSAPWTANCAEDGRLLPAPMLERRFGALGLEVGLPVHLYCGSGVTACHNALALRLLGVPARVYIGSWSEWASDPMRAVQN